MTPFEKFTKDYQNKNVLIFGLGLQGRGVGDARIFASIGAKVTVADTKTKHQLAPSLKQLSQYSIKYRLGTNPSPKKIAQYDVIVRNASIPWNHPVLKQARRLQIPIKMDASLFFEYAQPKKSIGITGTRGKTTTTYLIHHILTNCDLNAVIAGNASPTASLELLRNFDPNAWYVFELSSWQLQAFHQAQISPYIAVLTNIYPDHLLDRQPKEYLHDKSAITLYQSADDVFITSDTQPQTKSLLTATKAKTIFYNHQTLPKLNTTLKGDHNHNNLQAAFAVCRQIGLSSDSIVTSLNSFSPPHFRLEPVATINGVNIINDTTSTSPIATQVALETYPNSILILGGSTKNLPLKDLINTIDQKAKAIALIPGTGTDEITPFLDQNKIIINSKNLTRVLQASLKHAESGDTILFSPGFTSFGLFTNEFDRGHQFNHAINSLNQKQKVKKS